MVTIDEFENFEPEFTKLYKSSDIDYEIQVMRRGIEEFGDVNYHRWDFRLLVDGEIIVAEPFRHDISDRELTLENVANNLATFYSYGLHKTIERSRSEKKLSSESDIDRIIVQCHEFILREFYTSRDTSDGAFDVVHANLREPAWTVILMMRDQPGKLFMFEKTNSKSRVSISIYTKAYRFNINNF